MAASFRRTAWAFPAAYVAHVAEEAPGFTAWARRNASEHYTQTDFIRNNALGFVSTIAATAAITRSERRALGLAYYTLVLTQQAVFNALFPMGTTLAYREYSPGAVTSMLMLPLWWRRTRAALAEDRLGRRDVIACIVLAGIVHAGGIVRQVCSVGLPGDGADGSSGRSRVRSDGSDSSRT
jgi:Protein of unknown function with HXXEE motif